MASQLEPLLQQAERRAVVTVLRSRGDLTLERLCSLLTAEGSKRDVLRSLTLAELLAEPPKQVLPRDGSPPIDLARLQAAQHSSHAAFDHYLRQVLAEAAQPVGASYLRARLGGPRWKLASALARLIDSGIVERTGTTSATRYRLLPSHQSQM